MNKIEFKDAFKLAQTTTDLSAVDINIFKEYGLPDFKMVNCLIRQVAALIRWQCLQFNGEYNSIELDVIGKIGKRKFNIIY